VARGDLNDNATDEKAVERKIPRGGARKVRPRRSAAYAGSFPNNFEGAATSTSGLRAPVPQTGALTGLRYAPPGQVACGRCFWLLPARHDRQALNPQLAA
jgi:hypothetical protein